MVLDPNAWHVVLRDITIILAAAALILVTIFLAMVAWQLYKLAKEVHADSSPLLDAVTATALTIRDTVDYVNARVVLPAADTAGEAVELRNVARSGPLGQLRYFGKGMRKAQQADALAQRAATRPGGGSAPAGAPASDPGQGSVGGAGVDRDAGADAGRAEG